MTSSRPGRRPSPPVITRADPGPGRTGLRPVNRIRRSHVAPARHGVGDEATVSSQSLDGAPAERVRPETEHQLGAGSGPAFGGKRHRLAEGTASSPYGSGGLALATVRPARSVLRLSSEIVSSPRPRARRARPGRRLGRLRAPAGYGYGGLGRRQSPRARRTLGDFGSDRCPR